MILIRDEADKLLEINAGMAAERLQADLTLLQVLLHAQYEGVLTFGDIRFGLVTKKDQEKVQPPPGRLKLLAGAHATYHTSPPKTRSVHGRSESTMKLKSWFEKRVSCQSSNPATGRRKHSCMQTSAGACGCTGGDFRLQKARKSSYL